MKNTFGNNITVTIFGESHGDMIGVVLDGVVSGIEVDFEFISSQLDKRKPKGKISTARREADEYRIVSGVFDGKTTGTAICILIPNTNTKSCDYDKTKGIARPGHADYSARCKYLGFEDYRGGGHFSGRVTAALVAAGAIALQILKSKGIEIGTHIKKCAGISDREFSNISEDINLLNNTDFAVLDLNSAKTMRSKIEEAASLGDSVGGVLETCVLGFPKGMGEPWFDSVESILSHILFSVPAVKGVEFGSGFAMSDMIGSCANDALYFEDGKVYTKTNNNGGINGGITNGMPIVFKCAIKPTPSIYKEQDSINMDTGENVKLKIEGRHDPAIIHRARVVIDSVTALALIDILAGQNGTASLRGEI